MTYISHMTFEGKQMTQANTAQPDKAPFSDGSGFTPGPVSAQLRVWIEHFRTLSKSGLAPYDTSFDEALRLAEQADRPAVYGIIDPDYARVFTIARCIAWSEGYALMMHGSFTRDLDLLAVPWAENACEPEHLVNRIADNCDLKPTDRQPGAKPHGRLAWTLLFSAFGDPRFVDLSVMPRRAL